MQSSFNRAAPPLSRQDTRQWQRAQELLRKSRKSVTEIALEVGFNSSQYFATVFKEFTGTEARALRAASRSAERRDGNLVSEGKSA